MRSTPSSERDGARPGASGRILELDAYRGLAALAILLFHSPVRLTLPPRLLFVTGYFWTAVDFFFVLSGYLITTIILENMHGGAGFFKAFYARRVLRIFPIYYLSLAVVLLAGGLPSRSVLLSCLVFVQNVPLHWSRTAESLPGFGMSWSVAVEEQFYVLWPPMLCTIGARRLPWAALALIVVALCWRIAGPGGPYLYLGSRCDGLALGALLAWLLKDRRRVAAHRGRYSVAFAAIALALPAYYALGRRGIHALFVGLGLGISPDDVIVAVGLLAFNVSFFGLIGLTVCQSGRAWLAPLRWAPLCALGTISYGIYIYHVPIEFLMERSPRLHAALGGWYEPVWWGATIGVAAISWAFFEKPILAFRRLFPYPRATTDRPVAGPGHATAAGVQESTRS